MSRVIRAAFLILLFMTSSLLHASPDPAWYSHGADKQVLIHVDIFLTSTCHHCQKADAFFDEMRAKYPWLVVHRYIINQDKAALQTFYERLRQQNLNNFSVPGIFFCDSHWAGFADAKTTGKALTSALQYCHQQISKQGQLSQATVNVLQKLGRANQVQIGATFEHSAPLLVTIAALTDAFSPCSLFVFALLLAFLWLCPRGRMRWAVGLAFLLSLGIIHYIQQAHAVFYYQTMSKLTWLNIIAGFLVLLGLVYVYRNKAQPQWSSHAQAILLGFVILTVFAAQIYQQTCPFNVALVVEQWLTEQAYSSTKYMAYILFYQVIYLFPLMVFLIGYSLFIRKRTNDLQSPILKYTAYFILMATGVLLILYPQGLSSLAISIEVIFSGLFAGWVLIKGISKSDF